MRLADYSKTAAQVLLLLAATAMPAWAHSAEGPADLTAVCRENSARSERLEGLPGQILTAISLAESGRWNARRREIFAWPWTVYAEGRGRHFPSKAAAIAEVQRLRARGVQNIDVGCMQINLLHHADAFANLEEAFDPAANVAYAARFVKRLHRDTRSWSQATAFYHSRTRALGVAYRRKVFRLWREERQRVAEVRRLRRLEEYRKRRERRLAALGQQSRGRR